ncbi:MAG TPA: L-threonylcarbamoyladenylate synthase [Stellaceae bacterium]|nr:L-threonylcarbamoyladenylate synthase [Stellaceae bacterium]
MTELWSADRVEAAARLLRAGEAVAFPTETVYGLGGDATNDLAVARIFEAKGRPRFNPLITHVQDLATARTLAVFDARAEQIAERFWPGPLSLVLPRASRCPVSLLASAGLDTLAIRMPAHPIAHALLRATGRPLAAPSANRSGRVSPTRAADVLAELEGRIAAVLDGGPCRVGIESTVLDLSGAVPTLLRPGGVPREALEVVIGPVATAGVTDAAPRSPGLLESHYAPERPVRLDAHDRRPGEALLALGPGLAPEGFLEVRWLSRSGDLAEAAANLFASLRALDRPDIAGIAVMPIPEHGLGAAINDRLRRAAAPPRN